MSEKRFSDVELDYEMVVFEDNNKLTILSEDGLCNFLNQLYDESIKGSSSVMSDE